MKEIEEQAIIDNKNKILQMTEIKDEIKQSQTQAAEEQIQNGVTETFAKSNQVLEKQFEILSTIDLENPNADQIKEQMNSFSKNIFRNQIKVHNRVKNDFEFLKLFETSMTSLGIPLPS